METRLKLLTQPKNHLDVWRNIKKKPSDFNSNL